MLLCRRNLIRSAISARPSLCRLLSTPAKTDAGGSITTPSKEPEDPSINPDDITEKSPVQIKNEKLLSVDPHMIWGVTTPTSEPKLPENVSEISALDPAHLAHPESTTQTVRIRQMRRCPSQSPATVEEKWIISFNDDGATAETWTNPLMGWVSGADPTTNLHTQLVFNSAKEAVYLAKKRGWKYEVEEPIVRYMRDDGAQYQDNFLPQNVAAHVKRDGVKCDHWYRNESGTSHYWRPLTYHGDGVVGQYGPNPDEEVAENVEGKYKMR